LSNIRINEAPAHIRFHLRLALRGMMIAAVEKFLGTSEMPRNGASSGALARPTSDH
jgi:hypothetical protein